jgi:hypothetical protein
MDHICPLCNEPLNIGKTFISTENDDTPELPTKVFNNLPMLCIKPSCKNYCGSDTSNPKVIVETIKNELPIGG